MLIDNDENNDKEEDKIEESKGKLKRMKGKNKNDYEKQYKNIKNKRYESEVRERIEDGGDNNKDELKISNEIERTFRKHCELTSEVHANLKWESEF